MHKVKITECVVSRVLTAIATFAIKPCPVAPNVKV